MNPVVSETIISIGTGHNIPNSPVKEAGVRVEVRGNSGNSENKVADSAAEVQQNGTNEGTAKVDEITASEDDSDYQSDSGLRRELFYNYRGLSDSLEERKGRANRRVTQTQLYTQLVEDRLCFLEQEMDRILERGSSNLRQPSRTAPIHYPEIVRLNWADFKAVPFSDSSIKDWKHVGEIDFSPKNVLEVLVEHPQINETISTHNYEQSVPLSESSADSVRGKDVSPDLNESAMKIEHSAGVPVRLRIRSVALLRTLENISHDRVIGGRSVGKLVFLRPFKLLVTYADKIRSHLKELEQMHRTMGRYLTEDSDPKVEIESVTENAPAQQSKQRKKNLSEKQTVPETDTKSLSDKKDKLEGTGGGHLPLNQTETPEALEHLRLLINFMDTDLGPIWELRRRLKAGTLRKIAFSDLYHIFSHGQEIRTPGNKQIQLYVARSPGLSILLNAKFSIFWFLLTRTFRYRVLKFTGGREVMYPKMDALSNHASEKLKGEGYLSGLFVIECFYIDFDGTEYGPVNKTFMIRRFEGEKEIDSLPVFPLICDPNGVATRKALRDRGKRFAVLSNTKTTSHKQYSGLTSDQQQEQVSSVPKGLSFQVVGLQFFR